MTWEGYMRSVAKISLPVLAAAGLIAATTNPSEARITRITFDDAQRKVVEAKGDTPAFERLVGVAYGELDPKDKHDSLIQDIELAPRNSRGMVEYSTMFTLSKPLVMGAKPSVLFSDIVNRGNELVPRTFGMEGLDGDNFFIRQGALLLKSGWQGDIPWGAKSRTGVPLYALRAPIAKNADGSSIAGKVLTRIFNATGNTAPLVVYSHTLPFPYQPASLDTSKATLTERASETYSADDVIKSVPSSDWAWGDCSKTPFPGTPDPAKICMKNGFDPALLYELVYTAKDPIVLGIGFAATRDIVSFFKHQDKDSAGTANPIAKKVRMAIGFGASQTGQFVRTFLGLGFNEDEDGKVVWEGAMPHIAGRQLGLNLRFGLPDGTATPNVPDGQGVLWWGNAADELRNHPSSSLLARCQANNTCPKIFETFGSGEFWNLRMSASLVGTDGKRDIPLPPNMRRYYFPGTKHGGGDGGFTTTPEPAAADATQSRLYRSVCEFPENPNSHRASLRALYVSLVKWIDDNAEPPPSQFPKLADKTLVPDTKAAVQFPDIPGVTFRDHMAVPQFDYDFGPELKYNDVSGILVKMPPDLKHVIPAYVPRVDADGNEIAGVASVLHQAPVGTYTGWNVTANGFFKGQVCPFSGTVFPFATTEKERIAKKDPRPSLEARYHDHTGYVAAVKAAADRSVKARVLLADDAAVLVRQAEASNVLR